MNIAIHKRTDVIEHADKVLRDFQDMSQSLSYAAILTDDGFEVTNVSVNDISHNRMASMASSMQALGDAVARELRIGSSEYIIIASQNGYVIQLRIPNQPLVLTAHFGAAETLGKALSIARLAATNMGSLQLAEMA